MPSPPVVHYLESFDSEAFGDLGGTHELIDVKSSPHVVMITEPPEADEDPRWGCVLVYAARRRSCAAQ